MSYSCPFFLFNRHIETIYPALARRVAFDYQKRETIATPDDDFLEIGYSQKNSNTLAVISHGLEGSMDRAYVKGMAKACFDVGYDVMAWNFRGCGGKMNKQLRFYHSGATEDLDVVVKYAMAMNRYASITLIGFSLGGNLTLKYVGESRLRPHVLKSAVGISVPMDLHASCVKLSRPSNAIYHRRFLKSLKDKVIAKYNVMSGLTIAGIDKITTLKAFDDFYTAPLHGFASADDYYATCSSLKYVEAITIPTLILNAANDPFLSQECYPVSMLKNHRHVRFEKTDRGGHVGFAQFNTKNLYWSEQRTLDFIQGTVH